MTKTQENTKMTLLMFFAISILIFIIATILGMFLLDIKAKRQQPSVSFTLNGNIHPDSEVTYSNIHAHSHSTQTHGTRTRENSNMQNQKTSSPNADLYKNAYSAANQI